MKLVLSPVQQRWTALGLAGLVAAFVVWGAVMPLWEGVALRNEQMSMLRTQARRLEALTDARPRLEALVREVSADAGVRALAVEATQPSVGVAELQSTLSQIFGTAGATVTSGQGVEGSDTAQSRVAVRLQIETDIASLVRALTAIGKSRPLLTVESLSITEPDAEFVAVGPQPAVANRLIVEVVVSARLKGA